jgi:hypothetical protein
MTADTTTPRVGAVSRVLIGGAFALSVTAGFGIPWVIFLASIDLIRHAAAIGRELWERDPARHVTCIVWRSRRRRNGGRRPNRLALLAALCEDESRVALRIFVFGAELRYESMWP